MKKRPFSMFSRIQILLGKWKLQLNRRKWGNVRQKKIFCALKTPELPSKAVLQRTDFILIQLLQSPAACAPKKELYCFTSVVT